MATPDSNRSTAKLTHGRAATNPKQMRRHNAEVVLEALRGTEPMRVTELIERTQLSRPTVDAVADDLLSLGLISEVSQHQAAPRVRGRPPRRLAFRADSGYVLGMDIGENRIRAAVADLGGQILAERLVERPYVPEANSDEGDKRLALVRSTARSTLKAAGIDRSDLLASCIGCTGGIEIDTGRVLFSGAFPGLTNVNLRARLQRTVGPPVLVENDCNLAVVGERWRGVARGVDDVVCVLASERLGAGIVVRGQLVRGHAGAAGEMPFLGAYEDEHGAEGIAYLARLLGAEAVAREPAATHGRAPTGPTLSELVGGDPSQVDARAVFSAAEHGDPVATEIIQRSAQSAGRAIATIALVLNPELVVIGGGVANAGELLLDPLRRQLEHMARLPPRLEASALGERGVLVGAIRRALDHVEPRLLDRIDEAWNGQPDPRVESLANAGPT